MHPFTVPHPRQNQIHLELRDPAANAASHPEAEGDAAEGAGPLVSIAEPPLRPEGERLGEGVLVMADGIVRKCESGLKNNSEETKH